MGELSPLAFPSTAPREFRFALAGATLYLPTRRRLPARAAISFLDVTGEQGRHPAAPLSRSATSTRDEIVFAQAATGALAADALELPSTLGALERRMVLAQLVLKWATSPEMRTAEGVPLGGQPRQRRLIGRWPTIWRGSWMT